jgi:CBS domain-containing protein
MQVKECYRTVTQEASTVAAEASVQEVVQTILKDMVSRTVFVVDNDKKLMGAIQVKTILHMLGAKYTAEDSINLIHKIIGGKASGIMIKAPSVGLQDNLDDAVKKIVESEIQDLPVVDGQGRVIGELNCFELIKFYAEARWKTE